MGELVNAYYALDDDSSCVRIRNIIHSNYGHPHKVSQALLDKLASGPKCLIKIRRLYKPSAILL